MPNTALVTAVIPTYNRPSLVVRAVKTALTQTHTNMEVVVVLDGPEDSTSKALGAIADPRIQIVTLPQHQGACGARNAGVQTAKGEWIAFLDDDDEWLPLKIELQLRAAQRSVHKTPVISCRIIARGPFAEYTLPKRFPDPENPSASTCSIERVCSAGRGGWGLRHCSQGETFCSNIRSATGCDNIRTPTGLSGLHEKKGWDFSLSLPRW